MRSKIERTQEELNEVGPLNAKMEKLNHELKILKEV